MILTVTLNPAVDHQIFVERLNLGDTNRVIRTEIDAGGKGINLSRVFAELGGSTIATGFLGGSAGAIIRQVMSRQGCLDQFIEIHGETRINVSVEDGTDQPPTTFNEKGPVISEPDWDELKQRVLALSNTASWVCMGGSLPQSIPPHAYFELTEMLQSRGCRVLVDADGDAAKECLKAKPDFIKPNSAEASRLLGGPIDTTAEAVAAAQELRNQLAENAIVVISRGAEGAVLSCPEGTYIGESAPVEARSTIGSGDSFLGGMLWAMEEGMPMEEAFRWGLAAGAATATTDGTEIARKNVVHLLYRHTKVREA